MAQSYCDLASLRQLPQHTTGQLYHYYPFTPSLDADQLQNDLRWNAMRPQVRAFMLYSFIWSGHTAVRAECCTHT